MTWALASFALGMAAQWALSRYGVMKALKLAIQRRRSGDVEPSEFSHGWEGR